MERIKGIYEVEKLGVTVSADGKPKVGVDSDPESNDYRGYLVETEKESIFVLISDEQHCCEQPGYVTSDDNLDNFIGADLRSVEVVGEDYNIVSELLPDEDEYKATFTVFINFNTDRGVLQMAVYNQHNGYYGHDALFIKGKTVEEFAV